MNKQDSKRDSSDTDHISKLGGRLYVSEQGNLSSKWERVGC